MADFTKEAILQQFLEWISSFQDTVSSQGRLSLAPQKFVSMHTDQHIPVTKHPVFVIPLAIQIVDLDSAISMSQEQAGSEIEFTGHLVCDLGLLGRLRKSVLGLQCSA